MLKELKELIEKAIEAKPRARAMYSNFRVGAALLTDNGLTFTGVNIECSSFGLTVCAERVALFKAVSEGYLNFKRMAIVSDAKIFTPPCGACRQVLYDYCPQLEIIMADSYRNVKIINLKELYPLPFK